MLWAIAFGGALSVAIAFRIPLDSSSSSYRLLVFVISLAGLYPVAALMVKRLHDRNRPGYYAMVPLGLLTLWLAIETAFLRGTRGRNRYGPDPIGNAWRPSATTATFVVKKHG